MLDLGAADEIRPPGESKGPGSIVIDVQDGTKGAPAVPPVPPVPRGADVELPVPPAPPSVTVTDLPPEVREQIRRNVSGDLKKMGLGAALVVLFIPLFILAVIAKFFIDRSRAAQRMADLKRKEADYHRMSRQVTEAKLMALQAQVEPHFLYNTLASVQALTEVDPARAHTMTGHLIQNNFLFSKALGHGNTEICFLSVSVSQQLKRDTHASHRNSRSRRSRQVHVDCRAYRHTPGPSQGGTSPRDYHRARLRLDYPAQRRRGGHCGRTRPP